MTTPLDIMLGCKHCDEQVPPYDTADRNFKAWQCPHCKGWNNWMKFTSPAPITPQGNEGDDRVIDGQGNAPLPPWDLRDEDGDLHSPAWYLDAFITARETYHEAREKVANCNDDSFDGQLDDAYYELELYGTYINRLFGSDLVEGVWNKSEGEDE